MFAYNGVRAFCVCAYVYGYFYLGFDWRATGTS